MPLAATTTNAAKPLKEQAPRNFFPFSLVWFAVVVLAISIVGSHRIADTDIWVHLRNAQTSLATHSFPHADSYTFTSAGTPLIESEWLSELPYYFAFQAWHLRGLLALYLLLVALAYGGVFYLALRRGASPADTTLVSIGAVFLGSFSYGPRMHHFGWLCLVGVLIVLERFRQTGKGLWMLPIVFAFWINVHGSWVFGFVIIGIYVVAGLKEINSTHVLARRWTPAQLRQLLLGSAASVAALFLNPYGYKLVFYPFELLSGQALVRDSMTEWQSVDFHTFWGKLAMVMIVGLLAAAWFSFEPWLLSDILLATFAVWAALTHVRFLLFAAIVLVPILAPRLHLFPATEATKPRPWTNLFAACLVLAVIAWSYPSNAQLEKVIDAQFPRDALAYMQAHHINGRLFHYFGYGGYIEWYAPEIKTFADPRSDIFIYNGVLPDYLKIAAIDNSFELLDKYKIDYVLFPADKQLTYVLDHTSRWQRIYADKVVILFKKIP